MQCVTSWNDVPILIDTIYAGNILGLTDATVRRKIRNGEIRAANVGGEYRITKDELMNYLERSKV